MKKHSTILIAMLFCLMAGTAMAQVQNPYERMANNEDEVVHVDRWQRQAARPGELLVKFHDRSDIKLDGKQTSRLRFTSPTKSLGINAVLDSFAIETIEQLMPNYKMPKSARVSKSYGGGDVVERDLSQWHLIRLENGERKTENGAGAALSTNEYELMEALKRLPEVEAVEPNYICYALGAESVKPKAESVADATYCASNNLQGLQDFASKASRSSKSTFAPNDPMYSMQWGIQACRIDSLLTAPKRDTTWRPIIAIIDTGVDIDHSDLEDNIWTNPAEANGATNQDDDGNGFRDDVHGWDFVNQTAEMHDFNSHGTHCAGIAGAVTNNGIGIAGACPDALIMPVSVMQSDGTGDIATIIRGINYAAQNGADVISMSIGTYAYSIALEQALAVAYQTAVLVGAAGNDGYHIDPRCCPDPSHRMNDGPMFPGAFTFVLGVQATSQLGLAGFSNIDCDGASYSQFGEEELYNYELSAPGVDIMSTVPNGGYRNYNGTSMATPLVAGGVASLLQRREYLTKEILFGDLINYNTEFLPIDFWTVYNADSTAPAMLECVAIEINDTAYGDSSMYADAGERLQLYPTIRTVWGPTDSVEIWLDFQEFEDTSTIHILQNHVAFARPLSSYAHGKSINPIEIQIDSSVVDGRRIKLTLCAYSIDAEDTLRYNFTLPVTNGVKLFGMLLGNYTLYSNVQYVVTQNLGLSSGDTLFIKPGTTIKIKEGCSINATIMAIGKPDSMITFTKTDLGTKWNSILSGGGYFDYCVFEYFGYGGGNSGISNMSGGEVTILNSVYRYLEGNPLFTHVNINHSNIFYNRSGWPINWSYQGGLVYLKNCNITGNYISYGQHGSINMNSDFWRISYLYDPSIGQYRYDTIYQATGNNIFSNVDLNIEYNTGVMEIRTPDTNYYGSDKVDIIRKGIYDFETVGSTSFGYINLSKRASRPSPLAHGIVWKVEVNGYDAQDEFDSIIPLGVGTHEFKVYFNRAMDTSIVPMVAMGVRPPYTQTAISENASWSEDSTIYTAHLTLTGRSAIDGLNRIYVNGAQDDEHFEIPYENQRFNVYVASGGSMSAGFQATPGIGKIDLEWNDQEVNYEDFLGFNLYRYQYEQQLTNYHYDSEQGRYVYDTVNAPGDTIRINQSLVQDTTYTDYDVVPGTRYYYFYKILSTSLTENSPSKTVSCVPNSSIRGDANGSYAVDIADVITTINFVTGQNPQPFLVDAADVNGDGQINVLDIVGIINIILYGDHSKDNYEQQTAIYTIEDGVLYINTPVALGGLQFTLANCSREDIELLEAMNGFEIVHCVNTDGSLTLLAYSMTGKTIPVGKTALLRLGDKELTDIVLSDPEGHNVIALKGDEVGIVDVETLPAQIMKAFPNPFSSEVILDITTGFDSKELTLVFHDITGHQVHSATIATPTAGRYSYTWNAAGISKGIYLATIYVNGAAAHTVKLVVK